MLRQCITTGHLIRKVTKYLTWPAYTSVDDAEKTFREWLFSYQNSSFYQWAIVPKDLNEPIGSISVVDLDEKTEMVEIGYCIGRKWWHQGITAEALKAVIDFLFDQVKANRIQARHDGNNPNSGLVMKKCGMQYEGTMRGTAINNQWLCDVSYYAVLRSDR